MNLRRFDILAIKGRNDPVSKLVKWVTGSKYSHVALVLDDYIIMDTNFMSPAKPRLLDYNLGEFDCYRLVDPLTEKEEMKLNEFLQRAINSKYDLIEALAQVFSFLYKFENNKEFICLSLIFKGLRHVGREIDNISFDTLYSNIFREVTT